MLDSFGSAEIKDQVAAMEEQFGTVKKELAAAKREHVAAKEELAAGKHEHVAAKEELVVAKEQLAEKNEELDVLGKKLQESEAMHKQLQQHEGSAPGPEPVHSRRGKTKKLCMQPFYCNIIIHSK